MDCERLEAGRGGSSMAMRKAEIAQDARKALREQVDQHPGRIRIAGLKFGGGDQVISWIFEGYY